MTTTTEASTEAVDTAVVETAARTSRSLHQAANLVYALRKRLPFPPYVTSSVDGTAHVAWYTAVHIYDEQEAAAAVQQIRAAVGGTWDEQVTDTELKLTRQIGDLQLTITCDRKALGADAEAVAE